MRQARRQLTECWHQQHWTCQHRHRQQPCLSQLTHPHQLTPQLQPARPLLHLCWHRLWQSRQRLLPPAHWHGWAQQRGVPQAGWAGVAGRVARALKGAWEGGEACCLTGCQQQLLLLCGVLGLWAWLASGASTMTGTSHWLCFSPPWIWTRPAHTNEGMAAMSSLGSGLAVESMQRITGLPNAVQCTCSCVPSPRFETRPQEAVPRTTQTDHTTLTIVCRVLPHTRMHHKPQLNN